MLEIKVIDIHLPKSDIDLKVRRVNTSKAVALLGYVPDILISKDSNETPEEKAARALDPKNLIAFAKWACKGIVEHGNKKIVPEIENLKDDEYSYFDLDDIDQGILLQTVITGENPNKKKEPMTEF
jgi:hypothetical protein